MTHFTPRGADELFDELADDYEEMREELGWRPFPHVEDALRDLDLNGAEILDVGCGTGEVARRLNQRGARVTGADISAQMCFLAKVRVPESTFVRCNLEDGLPFENHSFDVVMAMGCMEYVPDLEAAAEELARVARPGGTVLYLIELCGSTMPDGGAREVRFLDQWVRHRRPMSEVCDHAHRVFRRARIDQVRGYLLEDTEEFVQYGRVIGIAR